MLGPLATEAQPEAYDLCAKHVESFTAGGGGVVRRRPTVGARAPPAPDHPPAGGAAVGEASRAPRPKPQPAEHSGRPGGILPASLTQAPDTLPDHLVGLGDGEIMRRGHLRVLRGEKED